MRYLKSGERSMRLLLRSACRSRLCAVRCVLCVALVCATSALHAATYTWLGLGFDNDWADTGNWDDPPNTFYPGYSAFSTTDVAVLPAASQSYLITLSGLIGISSIDVHAAYVLQNSGSLIMHQGVTGSGLTITDASNLYFYDSASAGSTAINVGNFGHLAFVSNSTAGTAMIDSVGYVSFQDHSTGANANVTLEGGILDVSNMAAPLALNSLHDTLASPGTLMLGTTALTLDSAANQVFHGSITGTGTLTQAGTGVLTLSGSNGSFSGALSVLAGELQVDGDFSAATVNVDTGGTLRGDGHTGAVSLVSGALVPGGGSGVGLEVASLACSVAEITFDLDAGTRLVVDQALTVAQCPQWHVTLAAALPIASGQIYDVATLASGTDYVVANITLAPPAGYTARAGHLGNDIVVTVYDATDDVFGDSFD